MRKMVFVTTIIAFIGFSANKDKEIKVSENNYNQAKLAFSELKEVLKKDNGRLWDYPLDGGILLINRETRTIIANESDTNNELVKYKDYYIGKFPDNLNIANSSVDWNNRLWTMVAFPLSELKAERLNILIHESFHRIQPLIGFDSINEIQNTHLDTKQGRIYLKLELEALKQALNSDKPEEHITHALLFRQYRYQVFPEAKISENSLEIKEGLAEYTGAILSGRSAIDLKKHFGSAIDWFYTFPTFVRSFAYCTIPIYGFFIQHADDAWNLKINKHTNLTDFILEFYKAKRSNISEKEILWIGKGYSMDSIIKVEQIRELQQVEQIKKYKQHFLGDSIIKIRLENMRIGFSPSNLIPLDSFGTVYPNLRITDNWGILEVDSCGALVSSDWMFVTISYPNLITDTLIQGKGYKLKLNKQWILHKENQRFELIKKY